MSSPLKAPRGGTSPPFWRSGHPGGARHEEFTGYGYVAGEYTPNTMTKLEGKRRKSGRLSPAVTHMTASRLRPVGARGLVGAPEKLMETQELFNTAWADDAERGADAPGRGYSAGPSFGASAGALMACSAR